MILDLVARLGEGDGVIVLCGPAGIGKTRLAREVMQRVEELGWATEEIVGGGRPSTIPLGPAAHLVPVIAGDVPLAGLMAATLDRLRLRARETTVAVLLDDADLLDEATKTLVNHMLSLPGLRVLATSRRTSGLQEHLGIVSREVVVEVQAVDPLSPVEVAELAGWHVGGEIEPSSSARLFDLTGGNPLWVIELVRAARKRGAVSDAGIQISIDIDRAFGGIDRLASERLGALGQRSYEMVKLVAAGGPLPVRLLEDREDPDLLRSLVDAGLMEVTGHQDSLVIRFAHPIYRQAVRSSLEPLERRRLLQELIARAGAPGPLIGGEAAQDRILLLKMGLWHAELGEPFDPDALGWAAQEMHWGLLNVMRQHLSGDLLSSVSDTAMAIGSYRPDERADAAYKLASGAWHRTGRFDDGIALAMLTLQQPTRAEVTVALLGDLRVLATTGEQKALVAIVHGMWLHWVARDREGAGRLLDAAAAEIGSPWREMVESTRAGLGVHSGTITSSLETLEAVQPDESAPSLAKLINWSPRAAALVTAGRLEDGVGLAARGLSLPLPPQGQALQAVEELTVVDHWGRFCLGYYEDVAKSAGAIAHLLKDTDQYEGRALMLGMEARCRFRQGRPSSAAEELGEAIRRHGPVSTLGFRALIHSSRAFALAWSGRLGDAEIEVTQALQWLDPPRFFDTDIELARATVLAAARRRGPALRVAEAAADAAASRGAWYFAFEGRFLAARMDATRARVGALQETAAHVDGAFPPLAVAYAEALRRRSGSELADLSGRAVDMGEGLMAVEMLEAALLFDRSTAVQRLKLQSAVADLRARNEGASSPLLPVPSAVPDLTRRELEIATLAGEGWSSSAIADELVLSVRTVESHLYRVFAKLGVGSRSELAQALGRSTGGLGPESGAEFAVERTRP